VHALVSYALLTCCQRCRASTAAHRLATIATWLSRMHVVSFLSASYCETAGCEQVDSPGDMDPKELETLLKLGKNFEHFQGSYEDLMAGVEYALGDGEAGASFRTSM
jgi:hypothetical protein